MPVPSPSFPGSAECRCDRSKLGPVPSIPGRGSNGERQSRRHELGMSQPTLSRRLNELERYVGAPVVLSSGVVGSKAHTGRRRPSALCRGIFSPRSTCSIRELRSRVGQRSSVVKISATEGMTKHWLLPRVRQLARSEQPSASRTHIEIHQQELATSDLDFVIRMGDPGESELIGKRVATVAFGILRVGGIPDGASRTSILGSTQGSRHYWPHGGVCRLQK